jgi:uncharacterized protein YqhQ
MKVRLGGMALTNGVLVHGPSAWACAIRDRDGQIRIASGRKRRFLPELETPFVRGPLRLAEAFALLPEVKRRLPAARFAFERPSVIVASVVVSTSIRLVRGSRLGDGSKEALAVIASLVPATIALRGGELASYHGAEHVSIGSYEHGGRATKEHERCGSHLVGPLLATSAVASLAVARLPRRAQGAGRVVGTLAALGSSVELFAWMGRHSDHPVARALARPGDLLQRHLSTEEPSPEQLAVANAALAACLELEE